MRSSLILSLLLVAAPLGAQTPEPSIARDVGIFFQGVNPNSGTPIVSVVTVPNGLILCGQGRVNVTDPVQNPTMIRFDDPDDQTKQCVLDPSVSREIFSKVPVGQNFGVALRNRGVTKLSDWSGLSEPFGHVVIEPPVTPTPEAKLPVPTGAMVE